MKYMVIKSKADIQKFMKIMEQNGYTIEGLRQIIELKTPRLKRGEPSIIKKYVSQVYTEKDIKLVSYLALNDGASKSTLYRLKKAANEKLANSLVQKD